MNETWMLMVMAIPLVAITGGLITSALAMHHRARLKELALRERIALIERGIKPPPEVDPAAFDRVCDEDATPTPPGSTCATHRTAGVILTGIGLGLILLIWLTSGDARLGVGIGGAVVILGGAFLVNSVLCARHERRLGYRTHRVSKNAGAENTGGDSGAPELP